MKSVKELIDIKLDLIHEFYDLQKIKLYSNIFKRKSIDKEIHRVNLQIHMINWFLGLESELWR